MFGGALGGLTALLLFGYAALPVIFSAVAGARCSETFIALCLLTVAAAGSFTKVIGLSDTLGAFIAGILLAETNYRNQVRT
jgi:Kef-type K+ transport system membrane component KefB